MAEDVKKLLKQALKFTQSGKLDKAIEAYQAIIKQTPKDTRALNNLGDLYLRKKMVDQAANVFNNLAQIYEEDGYTLRAIAICQKVLKIEPQAALVKARMADLYARQGLIVEARNHYLDLADLYDKQGKIKEALEIFRKLADLDPKNLSVRTKLGGMFHKEGMAREAAIEWSKAAEGYLKKNQTDTAVELLKQAIEADPDMHLARTLLAEEEIKNDQDDRAIELLKPVVESGKAAADSMKVYSAALLKKEMYEEAAETLKKALEKEPSSLPVQENLGLALLKSGQYKQAADSLMKIIGTYIHDNRWDKAGKIAADLRQANPEDPQVLQKLVEIHSHTNNQDALIATYTDLAGLYEKRGLKKNVLGIYEKLLEMEPENDQWTTKINELRGSLKVEPVEVPSGPKEVPPEETAVEEVDREELKDLEEDLGVMSAVGEEEKEEIILEFDQEVEVAETPIAAVENLLKRGLFKEAETKLEEIIKEEPTLENLSLMKELFRLQDRQSDYINASFDVAGFLEQKGLTEEAIKQYQGVLEADQGNQRAKKAIADLVVDSDIESSPAKEAIKVYAETEIVQVEDAVEITETELEAASELDLEKLAEEAVIEKSEESVPPSAGVEVEKEERIDAGVQEIAADSTVDIDDLQAEADFYYQQGLLEEAEKLYRGILIRDPNRTKVAGRLGEITGEEITPTAGEAQPELEEKVSGDLEEKLEIDFQPPSKEAKFKISTEEPEEEAVDRSGDFSDFLSSLKQELEGTEPALTPSGFEDEGLRDIFNEFKRGVKENLSDEDYETHYNLGIAYKEMGLMEESLAEFELAAKSEQFYLDAVSMTALCYKDIGQLQKAAGTLQKALMNIGPEDEERKGILWELALVFEEMGEKKKAVNIYLSVYEEDDSYRNIQEKLKGLGALQGAENKGVDKEAKNDKANENEAGGKKSTKVSYI